MTFYWVLAIAIVAYAIWRIVTAALKASVLRETAKQGNKITQYDLDNL